MNREHVEAVYEVLFTCAKEIVLNGQEHAPMLFLSNALGSPVLMNCPKTLWLPVQQMVLAGCKEDQFLIFVSEAWTVKRTGEIPDNLVPRECPDRTECLLFSFLGHHSQALASCAIKRNPTRIEKGELMFMGDDPRAMFGGNLVRERSTTTN